VSIPSESHAVNVPVLINFSAKQLGVIKQTCAKDTTDIEFDAFLEMCRARGLNPLLKHIYAMVLNKDSKDAKRPRQLVIIVAIDGQRVIANRTKDYRPDDHVTQFEIDAEMSEEDRRNNPARLISAQTGVYIYRHGEWHYVPHVAYWEEYAPIVEEWVYNEATGRSEKTGRLVLDPKKPNWRKMPRIMLAKCAEFGALRKAFPDDFGGTYGEEEMDKAHSIDLTASEMMAQARAEDRLKTLGGPGILMDFMSGGPLEKVPLGRFYDRCMGYLRDISGSPMTVTAWETRNVNGLREFWGLEPGEAYSLRKEIDKAKALIVEEPEPVPVKPAPKPAPKKASHAKPKAKAMPKLRLRDEPAEESESS